MSDSLKDMIGQFEKYDRMMRSADPLLELDLDKLKKALANMGVSPEDAANLEEIVRHPQKLSWKQGPSLPAEPLHWNPEPHQIEFFRELIRTARDGAVWGMPATGHHYRIEKSKQQFVLIRDVESDPDRWHDKNKMILGLLGWKMIDKRESTVNYLALAHNWSVGVFDFSIEAQLNTKTGENFPPGSRGQDAVATLITAPNLVRLGHHCARVLWNSILSVKLESGAGKTSAPWSHTTKED